MVEPRPPFSTLIFSRSAFSDPLIGRLPSGMYLKSAVLIACLFLGGRDKVWSRPPVIPLLGINSECNPCPATRLRKGPCNGYVVDHIVALECGGKDELENLQWQTVEEGRKKDKLERQCHNQQRWYQCQRVGVSHCERKRSGGKMV